MDPTKKLALVANGAMYDYQSLLPKIAACDETVAVDGGLFHCKQMGIRPDLILGDFDSIDKNLLNEYADVPHKQFPIEKDDTDLELAVAYGLAKGYRQILLFGALGKRLDHTMNNLYLLGRQPETLMAVTEDELLFAVRSKNLFLKPGQVISLLPLYGDVAVTTNGLKWDLKEQKLSYRFLSQSNVVLEDEITIDVKEGLVLCTLHHPSSVS